MSYPKTDIFKGFKNSKHVQFENIEALKNFMKTKKFGDVHKSRVDFLMNNFNEEILDPVTITFNYKNEYEVLDGQHRLAVIEKLGIKNFWVRIIDLKGRK